MSLSSAHLSASLSSAHESASLSSAHESASLSSVHQIASLSSASPRPPSSHGSPNDDNEKSQFANDRGQSKGRTDQEWENKVSYKHENDGSVANDSGFSKGSDTVEECRSRGASESILCIEM